MFYEASSLADCVGGNCFWVLFCVGVDGFGSCDLVLWGFGFLFGWVFGVCWVVG
jgi:Ca2+/Na+ antiporter